MDRGSGQGHDHCVQPIPQPLSRRTTDFINQLSRGVRVLIRLLVSSEFYVCRLRNGRKPGRLRLPGKLYGK
jgi:hypothetical protein